MCALRHDVTGIQSRGNTAPPSSTPPAVAVATRQLSHQYQDTPALSDVSLEVLQGEFMTLLGPSGSGKSTILHVIAGLIEPTSGSVILGERDVTKWPPQKRDVGLVFQSYALFPHMTVVGNISYPLRMRKVGREETRRRVSEVLELVELSNLADRYPAQLSGGQQQRVAIGRAIAASPRVLLLDEPLGALDRRLRQSLGLELRRIQRETEITTVYVTHDQEEAFSMSDRIVVMRDGQIRQVGSPREVYNEPTDTFVAGFVGDINLIPAVIAETRGSKTVLRGTNGQTYVSAQPCTHTTDSAIYCAIRPESVVLWQDQEEAPLASVQRFGQAKVVDCVFQGSAVRISLESNGASILAEVRGAQRAPQPGSSVYFGCAPTDLRVIATMSDEARSGDLQG